MKKTMKLISMLLMVVMICFTLTTAVSAVPAANKVEGIVTNIDQAQATGADKVSTIGGQIADIITTVGIVVAVIVILILGIKYMMGSASEKAEYKKTMIPYVVGAMLILGGSAIVKIIFSINIVG